MNYIELYKVCKDYADFVENHFKEVEAITNVTSKDIGSYQDIPDYETFNIMFNGDIVPKLLRKQDAVITPIQREVAESIFYSIEERHDMINTIKETLDEKLANDAIDDVLSALDEESITILKEEFTEDTIDEEEMLKDLMKDFFGDRNV